MLILWFDNGNVDMLWLESNMVGGLQGICVESETSS